MIITPVTNFHLSLDPPASRRSSYLPRPAGTHVSGILRAIALKIGKLEADDADIPTSEWGGLPIKALLRVALGLAWEEWLAPRIPDSAFHALTLQLNGIYGTPDGTRVRYDTAVLPILQPVALAIDELKVSWTTAARPVAERWLVLAQIKAYCWMMEQQHNVPCRDARLYSYHVNGDYGKSGQWDRGPVLDISDIEFTQDELRRNWQMILAHKDSAQVEYA